jgi:hypothetical protein
MRRFLSELRNRLAALRQPLLDAGVSETPSTYYVLSPYGAAPRGKVGWVYASPSLMHDERALTLELMLALVEARHCPQMSAPDPPPAAAFEARRILLDWLQRRAGQNGTRDAAQSGADLGTRAAIGNQIWRCETPQVTPATAGTS